MKPDPKPQPQTAQAAAPPPPRSNPATAPPQAPQSPWPAGGWSPLEPRWPLIQMPARAASTVNRARSWVEANPIMALCLAGLIFLAGRWVWMNRDQLLPDNINPPGPSSSLEKAGALRARLLPRYEAESFLEAARDIRDGDKPLADIRAAHSKRWAAAREKGFDDQFVKVFDRIIKPGTEKPSIEERRRYADAIEEIARGELNAVRSSSSARLPRVPWYWLLLNDPIRDPQPQPEPEPESDAALALED